MARAAILGETSTMGSINFTEILKVDPMCHGSLAAFEQATLLEW